MMRLIRSSTSIFGMAYDRQHILDTAYHYSNRIRDHILKCVIYSKNYRDYNHWIDEEIAVWISDVNDMKSKRGLKIKDKDYINNLFSSFGDELFNAKREVEIFHTNFVINHPDPYPDFNITKQLYSTYFYAWNDIRDRLYGNIGKFSANTSKQDISHILHDVLDRYCVSAPWLR